MFGSGLSALGRESSSTTPASTASGLFAALGYRPIIINNNPETVSTDFDTADGLYFEPVTLEDVLDVIDHEKPDGVVVQFGGQTAINLAQGLQRRASRFSAPRLDAIAEQKTAINSRSYLSRLEVPKPAGTGGALARGSHVVAEEIGYPVLVRPSFVLGGRAMEIVYDEDQLNWFYSEAEAANPGQPVLVDKYILGNEAEVDVIWDGEDTLVPGIMEHIERAEFTPATRWRSIQRSP